MDGVLFNEAVDAVGKGVEGFAGIIDVDREAEPSVGDNLLVVSRPADRYGWA